MKNKNHNPIKIILSLAIIIILNIGFLGTADAASVDSLVELANSSRAQNGLGSLTVSEKLVTAAHLKAQDMFKNGYFAHISPDGKTPWDFIGAAGYDYSYAGENLAIGYSQDVELNDAWMNSPSHRENIMNSNFNEIGMAVVDGNYHGSQTTIVVQMFGKLATASISDMPRVAAAQISNESTFNLIKSETSFSPTSIFTGEKINFKVAFTGSVKDIYATIGDEKIDLMGIESVIKNDSSSIYEKDMAIDKEGKFPVILVMTGTNGNKEVLSLGNVTVLPKVLANSTSNLSTKTNSGINSPLIMNLTIVSGLIVLVGSGYFIYLKQKSGHLA